MAAISDLDSAPSALGANPRQTPLVSLSLLIVAFFLGRFNQSSLYPLQEAMAAAKGLTDNDVALLQGPAFILPFVILSVPLGMAVDRTVRVPLLIAALLMGAIGSGATAYADSLATMFLGRALVGLSTSAVTVTVFSMISDIFPAEQRGRAKSAADVAGQVGGSAAFLFGGLVLAASDKGALGWRSALLLMTTPLVIGAAILLALREPVRAERPVVGPSTGQMLAELRTYLPLILPLIMGAVLIEIPIVGAFIWGAPILTRSFSLGAGEVGGIMSAVLLLSGLAGPILCGLLSDACHRTGGPRRAIGAVALLIFVSVPGCLFVAAPSAAIAAIILGLFMTCLSGALSMIVTAFTIVTPGQLRGLCLSLLSASAAVGGVALAPLLISWLSATFGGPAMIGKALACICFPSSLLACASLLLGMRALSRIGAYPPGQENGT
ncbi:MFS transporter [Sphingobium amiense]|uniref:MFS transporter n=1 Tax=Sphingobium amiense TaxID=135719 RepID=A0A494W4Z7_9SPHN|nr:MFS transporter [Sphingobium amiense]BBD99673.1 MFS transporter [Sphingobium amiense]